MSYAIIDAGVLKSSAISSSVGAGFKWVTGTILTGQTSVTVSHNLSSVPAGYALVATDVYASAAGLFVQPTNILANTAVIEIVNVQGVDITFLFGVIA